MQKIIKEGIRKIYAQYAEGKINKQTALDRLAAYLDSKGIPDYTLAALAAIKNWRR